MRSTNEKMTHKTLKEVCRDKVIHEAYVHGISRGNTREEVQQALLAMVDDGSLARLIEDYYKECLAKKVN